MSPLRDIFRAFAVLTAAVLYAGSTQAAPPRAADPSALVSGTSVVPAGFKCDFVGGKLVCGKTQNQGTSDGDQDNSDRPTKSKDKVIPKTCGKKVNCEAGYVKLEKPNKYGACCEAREGLPPPKPAEPAPQPAPAETPSPAAERVCCTASHPSGEPQKFCGLLNDARKQAGAARFNGEPAAQILCIPE